MSMKGRRILCALLAVVATGAGARPWSIDPARTRVHWEVDHFGTSTVRGRFDRVSGSATLDPAAGRGEVSVTVDTASVVSGLAPFDRILRGELMLASAAHPQAWYVAGRVEFDADGRPRVLHGELTLRGTSRPLRLEATRVACRTTPEGGERCGADFTGELRRSDFGITHALPFAADRVRLVVHVAAARAGR